MEYKDMRIGRFCDPFVQGMHIPGYMVAVMYRSEWRCKEWHKFCGDGKKHRQCKAKLNRTERLFNSFPAFVKVGEGKVRISNRVY